MTAFSNSVLEGKGLRSTTTASMPIFLARANAPAPNLSEITTHASASGILPAWISFTRFSMFVPLPETKNAILNIAALFKHFLPVFPRNQNHEFPNRIFFGELFDELGQRAACNLFKLFGQFASYYSFAV